jgi:teichuronic acid biosynthesis glycosyltransferase TuaC
LKILSFSSCFPSSLKPTEGIFVFDRLSAVAKKANVTVVHPFPSCPLIGPVNGGRLPPLETITPLTTSHLQFRYLPGVLKRLDGWFYYRGLLRWVTERCRQDRPDLLDGHFVWPDGVGVSLLAKHLKLPYVVTLRGTMNSRTRIPCFRKRIARVLWDAAEIISVSRPMADLAIQLGVDPNRVHVVPNGVNTRIFRPIARMDARRQLGLEKNRPLLVCVGYLTRPKGQEELIRALGQIPRGPHLALIGALADPPHYLRGLRRLAGRSALDGNVRFLGCVDRKTVATYLNAADVSVLPSHAEGCPNVVLESLACGTPVVATRVGGVPDLISPGTTGLIVPPKDPTALASALSDALTRRWSRQEIHRSVANHSWESVGEKVLAVLRSALSRP